jgi:IS1 family transposase
MNKLATEKRVAAVTALVEGCSMRATARMTGVARQTLIDLLVELGAACAAYQDRVFRNLRLRRIECDEVWSFIHCKAKNVARAKAAPDAAGDVWTWTAIDAETKLVPSWLVGTRDGGAATEFIRDLASRLAHRVQLTTDGHKAYLSAVEDGFGADVDYAQLVKIYGHSQETGDQRYSPAPCTGTIKQPVSGSPDPSLISTAYVERQNLTMRMSMRRFTRLTNGFSKKLENHAAAVALHFMHYNFARIHQSLRITPAMAAGVADHAWDVGEIVALLDAEPVNLVNAA